ncbi:M12 family metallopeptidase [Corallococcus terminator]
MHHVSVKFPLDWERTTVAAREHQGYLVLGHTILGKVEQLLSMSTSEVQAQSLPDGPTWQNKPILYSLDSNLSASVVQVIRDAATYFNTTTEVDWQEVPAATTSMVKFLPSGSQNNSGSTSWGPHTPEYGYFTWAKVELGTKASASVVRHEMMHALGFYHEQARLDRDTYVDVISSNGNSDIKNRNPIGHYDLVSRLHYDYSTSDFVFDLRNDPKVHTLFQREVRKYNNLPSDPVVTTETVRQYVGEGAELSYLDRYALKLKYTVSNDSLPFTVSATEETDPVKVEQAQLSSGQKLLRLGITNRSGLDAESWALRIGFKGEDTPARLAPFGVQNNGFLSTGLTAPPAPTPLTRTEVITPQEGNSRITNGKILYVYVVMNTGANGVLDGIGFCRLNSFDCLTTPLQGLDTLLPE